MRILGIDIGTQGVRGVVCDERGAVRAGAACSFAALNTAREPDYKEQRPEDWERAAREVIAACVKEADAPVDAVAVDGTSGTVVAIDRAGTPLIPAILYNDARAVRQAERVRRAGKQQEAEHGYSMGASFALPKIVWIKEHRPEIYEKTWKFIHQSDYIVGRLTGEFGVTDYSNALKTGYDLIREQWPQWIAGLPVDLEKLPEVTAPGRYIGCVGREAAARTGLPEGAAVYAGATDGYASSLAAGLAEPGEWATVIGTTMVLKGITKHLVTDPQGRIYSHKHPEGWWLPGGASNVGGRCLNEWFGKERFAEYNRTAESYTPTGILCYPLTMRGERFPFVRADAEGFCVGDGADVRKKYAGVMEGVGYAERLSYDVLTRLGCEVGDVVLTSGGACKSREWLQIRANILGKALKVPKETDAAMGSAMMAASGACGMRLSEAVSSMVRFAEEVAPQREKTAQYDALYADFLEECKKRRYLDEHL